MRSGLHFSLAWRILANKIRAQAGLTPIPYKVLWNTTYYCNSRCKTCNVWQIYPENGGSQKDEIRQTEVSRIIGSLGRHLLWLTLTGGEPTLKSGVAETVNDIYNACPRLALITVNTNAIIPKQTVKVLQTIASHCRRASVFAVLSLDAVGPLHDEIRGIAGNFAAVAECRRRMAELKEQLPNLHVAFQSTISRHNVGHLRELVDFCRSEGEGHSITFAQEAELYRNHGDAHDITGDLALLRCALDELTECFRVRTPADILQWCHMRLMLRFAEERRAPVPCTAGSATVTVGPTGQISGCLFRETSMGNAWDYGNNLMRLIRTERARSIQKACAECHQCWTNCESFPAMMSSPAKTLARILTARSQRLAAKRAYPRASS